MSNFRARLFEEHSELGHKIEKLKKFIVSGECARLPEIDRVDLSEQLEHMENYYSVLSNRVSRQCNNA